MRRFARSFGARRIRRCGATVPACARRTGAMRQGGHTAPCAVVRNGGHFISFAGWSRCVPCSLAPRGSAHCRSTARLPAMGATRHPRRSRRRVVRPGEGVCRDGRLRCRDGVEHVARARDGSIAGRRASRGDVFEPPRHVRAADDGALIAPRDSSMRAATAAVPPSLRPSVPLPAFAAIAQGAPSRIPRRFHARARPRGCSSGLRRHAGPGSWRHPIDSWRDCIASNGPGDLR